MSVAVPARDDALAVLRQLRNAGHTAYFAGGCVRDELLGLVPKDYDVATDAVPERVIEVFGRRRTQAVGAAFGVVLVKSGGSQIEVATFRADGSYRDGRRPDGVRFTDASEDAQRRDFTINGLFRDPLAGEGDPHDDGVIDHVGGRRDLRGRVLRCIGRPVDRFAEDHLRLLRAVRFAARFGLTIHPETAAALREYAGRLTTVTPERVGDEVRRMLRPATRGEAWRLLWEHALIGPTFRDLPIPPPQQGRHRPATRHVATLPGEASVTLAIAATLLDLLAGAGMPTADLFDPQAVARSVAAARSSLRLSNQETATLAMTLDVRPLLQEPTLATLRRFLALPTAADSRVLLEAYGDDPQVGEVVRSVLKRLDELREPTPEPWIGGDDLIAAGMRPGPQFKAALDAAFDAQLEGRVPDREAALQVALAHAT